MLFEDSTGSATELTNREAKMTNCDLSFNSDRGRIIMNNHHEECSARLFSNRWEYSVIVNTNLATPYYSSLYMHKWDSRQETQNTDNSQIPEICWLDELMNSGSLLDESIVDLYEACMRCPRICSTLFTFRFTSGLHRTSDSSSQS